MLSYPPRSLARQSLGPLLGSVLKFWIERKVPLVPLPIPGQRVAPQRKCRARCDFAREGEMNHLRSCLAPRSLQYDRGVDRGEGRNRGRLAMRRREVDTHFCGENNDFIAECDRADSILSVRGPPRMLGPIATDPPPWRCRPWRISRRLRSSIRSPPPRRSSRCRS